MPKPAPAATRALERGLRLLDLLAARPQGLPFARLREALALGDSALARLLAGLQGLGRVRRDPGTGVYQLAAPYSGPAGLHERLRTVCGPFLRDLSHEAGHTSLLVAWTGRYMVVLERILHEDSLPLQAMGRIAGNLRQPPWGWLFLPQERLLALPAGDEGPDDAEIRRELAAVPTQGYVVRRQVDRIRLAAPIREGEHVVGALAVGGQPLRWGRSHLEAVGRTLAGYALACSRLLSP